MLARLLLFVSLPMVSWSSRVSFMLLPGTENPGTGTRSVFPGTAGGWSNIYYDDDIIWLGGGIKPPAVAVTQVATVPAAHDSARMAAIEICDAPGFWSAADEVVADPALNDGLPACAFNAYLIKMLYSYRYSGINTSVAITDFT